MQLGGCRTFSWGRNGDQLLDIPHHAFGDTGNGREFNHFLKRVYLFPIVNDPRRQRRTNARQVV